MPKLRITKNSYFGTQEHYIGLSFDGFDILSVTKAPGPKLFAKKNLDLGIRATNTRHVIVDLLRRFLHKCR